MPRQRPACNILRTVIGHWDRLKRGEGTLTVDGETHVIRENDVVYIPAGMTHSLANLSAGVFEIFEIYAPAGRQFDFVVDE